MRASRAALIIFCSLVSMNAMAAGEPCGIAQDRINAAASGSILDLTGCIYSGTIRISKPLTIIGMTLNSPSGTSAVVVTASDVTLDRVTLRGPQATMFDANAVGVSAFGTAASRVYRLTIKDSVITRYGNAGLSLDYVTDTKVLRNRIEDAVYAGIMVLSAQRGLIQYNTVRRIGVVGSGENYGNAYGIAISQQDPTVDPQSTDVVVDANLVEDVPTWHGLDTHAGIRIQFTRNTVRRCQDGIFITGDDTYRRSLDVVTDSNQVEAPVGANQYGITYVYSTGGAIRNNNIVGWPSGHLILTSSDGDEQATAVNLTISGNTNNPSVPLPLPTPAPAPTPTPAPAPTPVPAPAPTPPLVAIASVSAKTLAFSSQLVGTTSSQQVVTITNTGTAALRFQSNFTMTGDFNFGTVGTCALEVSYAPGSSCTTSVVFNPTATGTRSGVLTIASNASPAQLAVTLTGTGSSVAADTTAPLTSITSPAAASTVPVRTTISISAQASDNVGVKTVEFYVNGSLQCTSLVAPYQCAWKVPRGRGKTYVLQTKARDAAGNVGISRSVSVTSH